MALLYNTGARVSEIPAVTVANVVLEDMACVHLHGKGRKQRAVPLWRSGHLDRDGAIDAAYASGGYLRKRSSESPLCDAEGFIQALEANYRRVYLG